MKGIILAGSRCNNKKLNIQWELEKNEILISAKDTKLSFFLEFDSHFSI